MTAARTMSYHPDWATFCSTNDLELRKITAYWLNKNHYKCVDADHEYTRGVWADSYIIFDQRQILTKFDPALAPIHTFMFHCIKNMVSKIEYARRKRIRPTDRADEISDDYVAPDADSNDLVYKIDINQFISEVQGYTCMEIPIKVFRTVYKTDRKTAARRHRISKFKVSLYLGRIRDVYQEYCRGNTGVEHWKREF